MDKIKSKKQDRLWAQAVIQTSQHFAVSTSYVRGAQNGTYKGGQTEDIKRYCNKIYSALCKALATPTA